MIESVEPGGVINASPVVWQRKKDEYLRLCADNRDHVKYKRLAEAYETPETLPDTKQLFHKRSVGNSIAKINLSLAFVQANLMTKFRKKLLLETRLRDCTN